MRHVTWPNVMVTTPADVLPQTTPNYGALATLDCARLNVAVPAHLERLAGDAFHLLPQLNLRLQRVAELALLLPGRCKKGSGCVSAFRGRHWGGKHLPMASATAMLSTGAQRRSHVYLRGGQPGQGWARGRDALWPCCCAAERPGGGTSDAPPLQRQLEVAVREARHLAHHLDAWAAGKQTETL